MIRHILTFGLVSQDRPKKTVDACLDEKLLFTTDHATVMAALRGHEKTSQQSYFRSRC
jgi:hypothetical protein